MGVLAAAAGLLAWVIIPAFPQSAPNYRDPQGRYTLRIPPGWNTVQMNGDAVQFHSGAAFETMIVSPSSDVDLMMNSTGSAIGKQWKNFGEARRGAARFGGRNGTYVVYSGRNPMGADAYMQVLAATDGNLTYMLLTSAPKSDFGRMKSAFDGIEQSFTLTAPAKAPDGPPPAPAGAIETPTARPAAGGPARTAAPAAAGGGEVYRMKLVKIVDERGFEAPMTALTLLIPTDWQFQGKVQYGQGTGCHANLVQLVFQATSPDGRFGIQLFPSNTWQWTDDAAMRNMMQAGNQQMARFGARGCDILAPMSADQYLRQRVLPAVRRDARAAGFEPMPDALQRMQQEAQQAQQVAARQGMRVNIRADAGRVRVNYMLSGQPVEEWVTAMTLSMGMAGPSYNIRTGRMGQATFYSNTADHVFAMRAPQGELDGREKFFRLIMGTVKVDPQWQARVMQVIANLNAQDSKGAADRSAIATKAGQDMSRMIHDAYENQQKSFDHSMANWSQYMRGVETFRNPNTGELVELTNQYEHAWSGPDGTYVVTDSSNFNPNSELRGNWTRLEAVRN